MRSEQEIPCGYYNVEPLEPGFWRIREDDVYMDLMVGSHHALLFDTGYGRGDLRAVVESITKLPLSVVCSHGHIDHACGCAAFGGAMVHPEDMALCREHNVMAGTETGELRPVQAHFDLGGLELQVIDLPGHTRGSIGLYCRERGLLFVGDAINGFLWLFLPEAAALETYIQTLHRAAALPFERMVQSHVAGTVPKEKLWDYLDLAEHLDFEAGTLVEAPMGHPGQTRICSRAGIHYDDRESPGHAAIMISREKLGGGDQ